MVGIALCHTIPRDNTIRVSIALFLISFILTAIAIGKREKSDSAATIAGTVGGAHRTFLMSADINLIDRDTSVVVCSNAAGVGVNCDMWVDAMRAVTASILVGFALTPLSIIAISVVTQVFGTTTNIILVSAVCTVLPALTSLFGVAYFFTTAISSASKAIGFTPKGHYDLARGVSTDLMIAAVTFHCAVLVLISLRIVVAIFFLPNWKRDSVIDRNIEGVMTSHMANDDWERQQQVWNSHKESVRGASPNQRDEEEDGEEHNKHEGEENHTHDNKREEGEGRHEPYETSSA